MFENMEILFWIIGSTFAMSLLAWVGIFALAIKESLLKKILLPMVAFSAGALMGGSFLHLLPKSVKVMGGGLNTFGWLLVGFAIFFLLEQFIQWHHCHRVPSEHKKPATYLILIADALHNFIGGLVIAGSFLVSISVGITTWVVAAAHEIPQELGDFGVMVHGGWDKYRALLFNFFAALTVVIGGLVAFFLSRNISTSFLLPFAAGNFLYIASSDLIPEIKQCEDLGEGLLHFLFFLLGLAILLAVKLLAGG